MTKSQNSRAPILMDSASDRTAKVYLEPEDRVQLVVDPLDDALYFTLELPGLYAVLNPLRRSIPIELQRLRTVPESVGLAAQASVAYFTTEGPKIAIVPAILAPSTIAEIFAAHPSLTALGHRAGLSFPDGRLNLRRKNA
jgi:hypothetical protein